MRTSQCEFRSRDIGKRVCNSHYVDQPKVHGATLKAVLTRLTVSGKEGG